MIHVQAPLHPRRYVPYAAAVLILVIGCALRIAWYPYQTSDYIYFVKVWFGILATHPWLSAFSQPFSDYAPLYLYMLKLLSFIPASSLWLSKSLSFAFDFAIALVAVALARNRSARAYDQGQLFLVFAIFLSIPTMMLNSSLWGQSDSLYAAPILLSLYYMLGDRPAAAATAFGFAVAVKMQAIFFLPVLIGYLWGARGTRRYLLIPPAIFAASVIPAMLAGGDVSYWPLVYLKQAGEYPYLSVSSPSIFAFVNSVSLPPVAAQSLFWGGIALALLWAFIVASASRHIRRLRPSSAVLLAYSCVLFIPYFLPRMHERYFFLADVISCALVLFAPRYWYLAVLTVLASGLAYMPYLSSQIAFLSAYSVDLRIPAAMLFACVCAAASGLIRISRSRDSDEPPARAAAQVAPQLDT